MIKKLCLVVNSVLFLNTFLLSGELTPETLLPVHNSKDAYTPSVGFGGGVFLVAWQSGRFAPGDMTKGLIPDRDIVGCRLESDGKLLEQTPFVICSAKDLQERPRIAFGNGLFLVVWQDLRNEKDWDVYAARIKPDGKLIDDNGLLVAGGAHNQALPDVTWGGKNFWVIWQDFRSGDFYEVYGTRVSPEGKVLDGQGILLDSGVKDVRHCYAPSTASAGSGRVFNLWVLKGDSVVYYKTPDSRGCIVTDGKIESGPIDYKEKKHGPAGNANPVCLSASSEGYMAVWRTDYHAGRGGSPGESTGALFDVQGKRIKSFFLAGKAHRIDAPEVCWDGKAFVAVWQENGASRGKPVYDVVYASRILSTGEVEGGNALFVSGKFESPAREGAVASDGGGTTMIVYEKHPEKSDVPIHIGFRILKSR